MHQFYNISQRTVAFAIVHDAPQPGGVHRIIRSFGAFQAVRTNIEEAEFSVFHQTYTDTGDNDAALADMQAIIEPDDTIIGYAYRSRSARSFGIGAGHSNRQSQLALPMVAIAPCIGAIVVTDDENALEEVAKAYRLPSTAIR